MNGKPQIFWSASTRGFYDAHLHAAALPDDVVALTSSRHAELLAGQAKGGAIVVGTDGKPHLDLPAKDLVTLRRNALLGLRQEARRRCLEVASLERQSNDNAAIAQAALQIASDGATAVDVAEPLSRRKAVDLVRAAHDAAAAIVATLDRSALLQFTAADPAHWPSEN